MEVFSKSRKKRYKFLWILRSLLTRSGDSSKIGNFSKWAGKSSFGASKVIDTAFESILFKFYDFSIFLPILAIFYPVLTKKRADQNDDFWEYFKSMLYVSKSKLGQKLSKSTKIRKFEKLRKNAIFWHLDHFHCPKTQFSSSNWRWAIFQFFDFFATQNRDIFRGELKNGLN